MSYMTARKRAENLGSSHEGTMHHWYTIVTSVTLTALVPVFIFTFGSILGRSHEGVLEAMGRPFPAIVVGLTILVSLIHFRNGVQVVLEDYAHGAPRRIMVIVAVIVSYAILAVGLFAVARLAL